MSRSVADIYHTHIFVKIKDTAYVYETRSYLFIVNIWYLTVFGIKKNNLLQDLRIKYSNAFSAN